MKTTRHPFALLFALVMLGVAMAASCAQAADALKKLKSEYRFVMIPILTQAWFDIVHSAAVQAADDLGRTMGTKIVIDYQAPAQADLVEQNTLLERAIATNPDGIAIDAIDVKSSLPILKEAQSRGIPVVLFVSTAPEGSQLTYISNDFYEQGMIEGRELLKKIHEKGNVAILQGVPTNSAHADRYRALTELFKQYPDVHVVDTGFDSDDVEKAQTESGRMLAAHPDLDGFAVVDAAGPVGLGLALKEAGRVGKVSFIGIDDVPQLQELMRQGVLDLSIATRPRMMGRWSTISLLMKNLGIDTPIWLNTGIGYLRPDMVKNGNIEGF